MNHLLKTRSPVAILYLSTSISRTINRSKHFDYIDNLHEREKPITVLLIILSESKEKNFNVFP